MLPSWMSSFLLWLFGNALWDFLFAVVIAGVIAYLRSKKEQWAGPALYGLAAFTLVLIVGFVLTGRPPLSPPPEGVTPENIEANIKTWADHLAMSLERQNAPDADFFSYLGRVHQDDPLEIFRAKEKPGYLQLRATLTLSPEHRAALAKLSERDATNFIDQLNLDVARFKMTVAMGVTFDARRQPLDISLLIQKAIPIHNLNEGFFADQFDEVTSAVHQVKAATNLGLGTQIFKLSQ